MHAPAVIASLAGGAAVFAWRLRETQTPVTARKLLIPPAGMSTGFLMFLVPQTRVPLAWGALAFLAGALLLSYPLIQSSRLMRRGGDIIMQRSRAFLWILLGLLVVRIVARSYIERYINTVQTGSLFFVLAFGMLLPWRLTLYARYRRLRAQPA
jgi:membrane protein CcdC involved in cytochrome C biogenesis